MIQSVNHCYWFHVSLRRVPRFVGINRRPDEDRRARDRGALPLCQMRGALPLSLHFNDASLKGPAFHFGLIHFTSDDFRLGWFPASGSESTSDSDESPVTVCELGSCIVCVIASSGRSESADVSVPIPAYPYRTDSGPPVNPIPTSIRFRWRSMSGKYARSRLGQRLGAAPCGPRCAAARSSSSSPRPAAVGSAAGRPRWALARQG